MKMPILFVAAIGIAGNTAAQICGPAPQLGTCYPCSPGHAGVHLVYGTGAIGTSVCAWAGPDSMFTGWSTGSLATPVPLTLVIPGSFGVILIDPGAGFLGTTVSIGGGAWTIPNNPLLIGTDIHSQTLQFGCCATGSTNYAWNATNANFFTIQ